MPLATDFNTDPNCWTVDPDMTFGGILGSDNILALGRRYGHSEENSSGGLWLPDTINASGFRLNPEPLNDH